MPISEAPKQKHLLSMKLWRFLGFRLSGRLSGTQSDIKRCGQNAPFRRGGIVRALTNSLSERRDHSHLARVCRQNRYDFDGEDLNHAIEAAGPQHVDEHRVEATEPESSPCRV
jgi:hypothetical protein